MLKNFLLFILSLSLLFLVNAFSVAAEPNSAADNGCVQLFESNCAECHGLDRGCARLGQSPEKWKKLFKFMESMGADIDQQARLIDCLSKPGDSTKATCSKNK